MAELSFFKREGDGMTGTSNHWAVAPTGNYGQDFAHGKALAQELAEHIASGGIAAQLSWSVNDMPSEGKKTGVEAGFLWGIAELAAMAVNPKVSEVKTKPNASIKASAEEVEGHATPGLLAGHMAALLRVTRVASKTGEVSRNDMTDALWLLSEVAGLIESAADVLGEAEFWLQQHKDAEKSQDKLNGGGHEIG